MVTAIENLYAVGLVAFVGVLIAFIVVVIIKRTNTSDLLRILRRKPLFLPGLLFLLIVFVYPGGRIGPPTDLMDNHVVRDYTSSFTSSFDVVDTEPYLPRVRVTYTSDITEDEYVTCTVLVLQQETLVANVSTTLHRSDSYEAESSYSTFDLPVGNYSLQFSQIVYELDGTQTIRRRYIHVQFEQLQNQEWIQQSIIWDQYRLLLLCIGFGLFLIGIYLTDHNEDNDVERERYERKKHGWRNYPYTRSERRKFRKRQWTERTRQKR